MALRDEGVRCYARALSPVQAPRERACTSRDVALRQGFGARAARARRLAGLGLVSVAVTSSIQRDVQASGVRLRVVETGAGPSLVLLHGLFLDHSCWDGVAALLRDDYRIVAPDLPGFGLSEKPAAPRFQYGINAFANAIVDLYAGLELGRAIIVGHALGGAVAITLAARYPELIARLVLVDALCYPARTDLARRVGLAPLVGGFLFKQLWGRTTFRAYFRDAYLSKPDAVSNATLDRYYEAFNSPAARASALSTLRATRDTRSVVADIARITTPTLVIWGQDDAILPVAHAQRMAREIRGAGLQVLDAGHAPHVEAPEQVAAAIRRFCGPRR